MRICNGFQSALSSAEYATMSIFHMDESIEEGRPYGKA
jgi:hypothetical protein